MNADDIILHRAEQDLDVGLEHLRTLLRARIHNPFVQKPLEAAVFGAVHSIGLKTRFKDDVRFLLALAHRVAKGEDPRKLAEENIAHVLRMNQLGLVVRVKDAEFVPLLARDIDLFTARLPDLARMATVEAPADYADVVRRAFPDRARVEAIVEANRAHIAWTIAHFQAHPHLLRIPHAWHAKLAEVAREVVEWQTARVLVGVAEIYSVAP